MSACRENKSDASYIFASPLKTREVTRLEDGPPSDLMKAYLANKAVLDRFLRARLGVPHDAEDLLQELYIKLKFTQTPPDLRDPVAYIFRVALNLVRDHRRERMRARVRESDWADSRTIVHGSESVSDAPSTEAAYAAKQRLAAIRSALEELSPQCRQAFLLHKFEGLSHEEVARRGGITRSTVEKHMRTALLHLVKRVGRD